MGIGIFYAVVIFLASILGAIVGLGGAVFFRPIFDAVGYHDVQNILFIASSAILTMAVVSTVKKVRDGIDVDIKIALLISLGAVAGGSAGQFIINYLTDIFPNDAVQRIQIVVMVVFLCTALFLASKKNLRYQVKNKILCVLLGIVLGAFSAFLGIGGGPINVPVMMILFSQPIKTATTYSIIIIFFSQLSSLVSMGVTIGFGAFDLRMLLFVVPAAALGGLVGARFSKIFSDTTVKRLFTAAIAVVIIFNVINGIFVI